MWILGPIVAALLLYLFQVSAVMCALEDGKFNRKREFWFCMIPLVYPVIAAKWVIKDALKGTIKDYKKLK